jgi:hypothetical protein
MKREIPLKQIAPCGLVCHTCVAAKGGVIQRHSLELLRLLESFDRYAEKFSCYEERLKSYPEFKSVLQLLGEASCEGCRDGICKYPGCGISPCARGKGHDFCFECPSFPCEEADFDTVLKDKWLKANRRMKEIGVEAYFEETKNISHYNK